jgi:hypothetical protein
MARYSSVAYFTAYADQSDGDETEELVFPEDLSSLDDAALNELHDQATTIFNGLYGDGSAVDADTLTQLEALAAGIDSVRGEINTRAEAQSERSEAAAKLADRLNPAAEAEQAEETEDETAEDAETIEVPDDASEITEAEAVAASAGKKEIKVNLSRFKSSQGRSPRPFGKAESMRDIVTAAPDMPGYANGQGMDWGDIGKGINRRLGNFNSSVYQRAQREGRHMRQQYSVALYRKPIDPTLQITSDDPAHIDAVMDRAVDETRLPGGSLVASGGWCAPSETVYDLCNLSSRDGMISVPEVGVSRGGIRYASSPSFADVYNDTGFCFDEQADIDGNYAVDENGDPVEGPKPCAEVPCPDFTDYRLNVCGTCITSGLLQARGYPEALTDFTQKAMIAHDHRLNARTIQELISYSTAVTYPAPQAGATAPILSSIEFQRELILQGERMGRNTSMEGIFPFWVRGVIRADLSRRLGVDLIDVPDSRINAWFTQRGINPQFVYDWQDLDPTATEYPDTLDFLMYPAGSFVKGTEDVISLDTLYDSTMLGENNYTALFFEEGWLVAPRCGESRLITIPLCPNGSTHSGELIDCNGTGSGSAS